MNVNRFSRIDGKRWGLGGVVVIALVALGYALGQKGQMALPAVEARAESVVAASGVSAPPNLTVRSEELYVTIAEQVMPSVVNISTTQQVRSRQRRGGWPTHPFFPGFPLEEGIPDWAPGPGDRGERPQSLGTGFVFEISGGDALILTNHHVIDSADQIYVRFTENREESESRAELVGSDPELDVALLRVRAREDARAVVLGDSEALRVGEWVAALGNPFGHGHSMTHGIVSAKARTLPGGWGRYLQTDAPINPGNSGGPLVNLRGEVVGINNAIDARGPGIGFAIPVNSVKAILSQLKTKGEIERGYIGVSIGALAQTRIRDTGKYGPEQPVILQVVPGEPAAKAGIQGYDIVLEVNGASVRAADELLQAVTSVPVGERVTLKVDRGGAIKTFEMKTVKRPQRGR